MAGLRRFLFFDNISPALENTRSHGTDEADEEKSIVLHNTKRLCVLNHHADQVFINFTFIS